MELYTLVILCIYLGVIAIVFGLVFTCRCGRCRMNGRLLISGITNRFKRISG